MADSGGDTEARAAGPAMSDRERWQERHRGLPPRATPSRFVATHVTHQARSGPCGRALDVASGAGRHAALLSSLGYDTVAVDHASEACHRLAAEIPGTDPVVGDAVALPFRPASFGVVVQTLFLERTIFPDLLRLLVPGGLLVVETFLAAQHAATGHPRLDFCLAPGELRALATGTGVDVRVLDEREGPVPAGEGIAHLAAIAVCKV